MADEKPVAFLGSSLDDLKAFPKTIQRLAGYELGKVQSGAEPADWKPMASIGQGVKEIRIRDENGAFRIIFVAKFADAVYVLHCFHKQTRATSKPDLEIAKARYRDLLKEIKS
jgi:phage-related protein